MNFLLFKLHSTRTFNFMSGKHKIRDNKVDFDFVANEGYTFPDRNIPNIIGFRGTQTPFSIHIGNEDLAKRRIVVAEYPYDLISGNNLIFVYTDLIEYQNTGDVKATILKVGNASRTVSFHHRLWRGDHFLICNSKKCWYKTYKQAASHLDVRQGICFYLMALGKFF